MKNETIDPVWSISPLDGRYRNKLEHLGPVVSEGALIRYRLWVEAAWLLHLSEVPAIRKDMGELPPKAREWLQFLCQPHEFVNVGAVKQIEETTNHDVKAVEYFMQEQLRLFDADERTVAFIHFACTSEDINNTSYALMVDQVTRTQILPAMDEIIADLTRVCDESAALPMLSRTHGQTASPTTLGKEMAVFAHRLIRQRQQLATVKMGCKMSGAVGNYNAHLAAYPDLDWQEISRSFLEERLGFEQNPLTTQIENHDSLIEWADALRRFNVILLGLCRDIWSYISIGYFSQRTKAGEIGSSTMPHKVNPIDFENAEGNLGIANALAQHFGEKLPISRWQRDLSDSTVLRSVGTLAGHSLLAFKSCQKGLGKLQVNEARIGADLEQAWEVLAEPIQTVMRRYGVTDAYERLKEATRGKAVDQRALYAVIDKCDALPEQAKAELKAMTPRSYVGLASHLAQHAGAHRT